jgi:hypothetical protein
MVWRWDAVSDEGAGTRRQHLVAHRIQRFGQVQVVEVRPAIVGAIGEHRAHDRRIANRARSCSSTRYAGVLELAQLDHAAGANIRFDVIGTGGILAPGGAHAHDVARLGGHLVIRAVDNRQPHRVEVAQHGFAQAGRDAGIVVGQEQQMGGREIAAQLLRNGQQVTCVERHHGRHVKGGGHAHRLAGGIPFTNLDQGRGGRSRAQQAACADHVHVGAEALGAIGFDPLQAGHDRAVQAVLARRDQQLAVRRDARAFATDAFAFKVGVALRDGVDRFGPGVARTVGGHLGIAQLGLCRRALVFSLFALGLSPLFGRNTFPVERDLHLVIVVALPDAVGASDHAPARTQVQLAQHVPGFFLRAEAADLAVEDRMAGRQAW